MHLVIRVSKKRPLSTMARAKLYGITTFCFVLVRGVWGSKIQKKNVCRFGLSIVDLGGYLHRKYYEINSLKAPWNYSASISTYNFSLCLCERSKPNISMISAFLDPWEPLLMNLNIPKLLSKYKKDGSLFEYYFCKSQRLGF